MELHLRPAWLGDKAGAPLSSRDASRGVSGALRFVRDNTWTVPLNFADRPPLVPEAVDIEFTAKLGEDVIVNLSQLTPTILADARTHRKLSLMLFTKAPATHWIKYHSVYASDKRTQPTLSIKVKGQGIGQKFIRIPTAN